MSGWQTPPEKRENIGEWSALPDSAVKATHQRVRGIVEQHVRGGHSITQIATSCYLQGLADAGEVMKRRGIKL